jgi:endonuclease/exonuclease/phosphatase (EEP) superfamily protein YafD
MHRVMRHLLTVSLLAGLSLAPLSAVSITSADLIVESTACSASTNAPELHNVATGLDPQRIQVLNWNLQKADHPAFNADIAALSAGADLLVFQEARLQAEAVNALGAYPYAMFAPGYTTASQTTGVLTLSHTPPLSHCSLSHIEPWLRSPKATSVSYFAIEQSASSLLVINLHAVNFTFGSVDFEEQLAASARLIAAHSGPVLFAGDFNTWNATRKSALNALAGELELEAVTFADDQRVRVMGYAMDHILVRNLQVLASQVHPVQSSDHNALSVTLAVKG